MDGDCVIVRSAEPLNGEVEVAGAKNAALGILASFLLAPGRSILKDVPNISDVVHMSEILRELGASVVFDSCANTMEVDASEISSCVVSPELMTKLRASFWVAGPLLARFGKVCVGIPGGCQLETTTGSNVLTRGRGIDYHVKGFAALGAEICVVDGVLEMRLSKKAKESRNLSKIFLDYPSVGATESILMCASLLERETHLFNAALEPEIFDLIAVLRKMGAKIECHVPNLIKIIGKRQLRPVEHRLIPDRMEAGSVLLAIAATGGTGGIPNAVSGDLGLFLEKLKEMGHSVRTGVDGRGIWLKACKSPRAIGFRTAPHPGFPTDLQAPTVAALLRAKGQSMVMETVYGNRAAHVDELCKLGGELSVQGQKIIVDGVDSLRGSDLSALNIRMAYALVIGGLSSVGTTRVFGLSHLRRGYDRFEEKLQSLGANLVVKEASTDEQQRIAQQLLL